MNKQILLVFTFEDTPEDIGNFERFRKDLEDDYDAHSRYIAARDMMRVCHFVAEYRNVDDAG